MDDDMKQKVLRNEIRRCDSCGKKVKYFLVADGESVGDYFKRVNSRHCGPAIKKCPKCGKKLSLGSTSSCSQK